jgi:hypothetical protein
VNENLERFPTIYKLVLYYFLIKINFGCSITVDSHVTKVHLLQTFLDPQKHDLIDNDVETYLGSHLSVTTPQRKSNLSVEGFSVFCWRFDN